MPLRDVLLMLVVAVSWSGGWIAGKVAVLAVPPIAMSAVRFLVAGLILLAMARLNRAAQLVGGALALAGVRVAAVPSGEGARLRRFAGV